MLAGTAVGTVAIVAWRIKETQRPVTLPKIILPPLFQSTGALMFLAPRFRVPLEWAAVAFLLGATVFALPMIRMTHLQVRPDGIWVNRSRAFFAVMMALVAVRVALHDYLDHLITPAQTAGLFFLLALGMMGHWRLNMLFNFLRLKREAGQ